MTVGPAAETAPRGQFPFLHALSRPAALLDRDGRILAVNEAWRRLGGTADGFAGAQAGAGADYPAACAAGGSPCWG